MARSLRSRTNGRLHSLALGFVLLAAMACGPAELSAVPDDLTGTWRTRAPGYERSYLRLEARRFTIGMGQFELFTYAIDRVERSQEPGGTLVYALHYTAEEGYPDKLILTVDPAAPARFVMGSASQVWKRDG